MCFVGPRKDYPRNARGNRHSNFIVCIDIAGQQYTIYSDKISIPPSSPGCKIQLHICFVAGRGPVPVTLDITHESITALGHLYGEIKGTQAAVRLNDRHYVNKKMIVRTKRAA